ncbi:MAG: nucleotidyltransferase domain-containing protein [Candidatus Bathyarchaeota archaeon]|nr:nucleotidyltransferase domain-containing protein [Candidatus Bathyarchaeota archaeon]
MSRADVAREAARILYNRKIKEYKDAKEVAALSLGTTSLPSNYEVAVELDRLTEEQEGSDRHTRLVEMRNIALKVMEDLKDLTPVLIGSVWRGTTRIGSDIDIIVYHPDSVKVAKRLGNYHLVEAEKTEFVVNGVPKVSTHIKMLIDDYPVEVVVRPPEDREYYRDERCETYGDIKKGITLPELEKLMRTDPLRRFIPRRRQR